MIMQFAARLFDRFPWLAEFAESGDAGASSGDLLVRVPSPTGDQDRSLIVWLEDGEPSVRFGWWHTHATTWDPPEHGDEWDGILDLIEAIFADRIVLTEDVAGDWAGRLGFVDLRETESLSHELASDGIPRRARLKSWTGEEDRLVVSDDDGLRTLTAPHDRID